MRIFAIFACCVSMTLAQPCLGQTVEKEDTASNRALVDAFSDARNGFDAAALDGLLAPDYVEISPRGEIDTRENVLSFYAPDKATPVPPMTRSIEFINRYGDIAVAVGTVSFSFAKPDGETISRAVRVTYVEQLVGGRWQMLSTQYTGVQPAPGPSAAN